MLKRPEEERVIRVPRTLHLDVPRVAIAEIEVYARKLAGDLEVCRRPNTQSVSLIAAGHRTQHLQDCQSVL